MSDKENSEGNQQAVHITIEGRVQGVGFRHFTTVNAQELGLYGWVRNREDGSVEIWAEGSEEKLKGLLKKVRKGPSHAWVRDVNVEWKEPSGDTRSFRVRS